MTLVARKEYFLSRLGRALYFLSKPLDPPARRRCRAQCVDCTNANGISTIKATYRGCCISVEIDPRRTGTSPARTAPREGMPGPRMPAKQQKQYRYKLLQSGAGKCQSRGRIK